MQVSIVFAITFVFFSIFRFIRQLENKEADKDATLEFARLILSKAHPNAVNTIKQWISTIEAKWKELVGWAERRRQKLSEHLAGLRDQSDHWQELMAWLKAREERLIKLELHPLPNDLDDLVVLIHVNI